MSKKKSSKSSKFDYEAFEKLAISGLQSGQGLVGSEGLLKELMSHLVESSLEGELAYHLSQSKERGEANRRNGYTKKKLQTSIGDINIQPPRDRRGDFSPQIVEKWERKLHSGFDAHLSIKS